MTPGLVVTQQLGRSIAARPDNTFISTWSQQSNIYFAIHNSDGTHGGAVGVGVGEITSVAVDGAGNFVIAWVGYEGDHSYGVYAQRYTAAGAATGPQLHVNEYTTSNQTMVAVAMNAGGEFVVAWQSSGQDGNLFEIYARRFDEFSVPQSGEFRVNETVANSQIFASVAMNGDGAFVVTWANQTANLAPLGNKMRRYDSAGTPLAGEEVIQPLDASTAAVAFNPNGEFAVAYVHQSKAYLQRYTAAGVKTGAAVLIGAVTVRDVRLDVNAAGMYAVAFDSEHRIHLRLVAADGTPLSHEIGMAASNAPVKYTPWVALKPNGEAVVSWSIPVNPGFQFELQQLRLVRAVRHDANGDGTGDITVQRHDQIAGWLMKNANIDSTWAWQESGVDVIGTLTTSPVLQDRPSRTIRLPYSRIVGTPPPGWEGRGTGDFDGDTNIDIVLHNRTTGEVALWLLTYEGKIRAGAVIANIPLAWHIRAAGDVNADGKDDLVLQHETTREVAVWKMDGFVIAAGAIIAAPASGWRVRTTGDFNGDGRSDISLQNTASGEVALWLLDGFTITGAAVAGIVPGTWRLGGSSDINGDGRDDLVFMDTNDFRYAVWTMNGTAITQGKLLGLAAGYELAMQAPNP